MRVASGLVLAGLLLELGWLLVAAASVPLSESRGGFTADFLDALPLAVRQGFDRARDALMIPVGELLGTDDRRDTCKVILLAALPVTIVGYVLGIWAMRRGSFERAGRLIIGFTIVFHATLLMTPGLLSVDVVGYAAFGRLEAVHGLNPYIVPVPKGMELYDQLEARTIPHGPANFTTPYGPVWTAIGVGLARLTAEQHPLTQVLIYRLLGSAALLVCMALLWRLQAAQGVAANERTFMLLVLAWNPLILFELVANAHNDGFMLLLVLVGLLLLSTTARLAPVAAIAMFTLAALVKFVPLILVVLASTAWLRSLSGARARMAAVGAVLLVVASLVGLLAAPFVEPSRPFAMLSSAAAGGGTYVNVIWDLPTSWIATRWVDRSGEQLAAALDAVRSWPQAVVRILFAVYLLFEIGRLWVTGPREPLARTQAVAEVWVRATLVGLLVAFNQVLVWYYVWPLIVAAMLGWRHQLCKLTVAYSVLYLLLFYAFRVDLVRDRGFWLLAYELGPLVWLFLLSRTGTLRRESLRTQPVGQVV